MKKQTKSSYPLSVIFIWLILAAQLLTINGTQVYKKEKKAIFWDVLEYYSYLPATFIYGDIKLGFMNDNSVNWQNKFWPRQTPDHHRVFKMTMGMSVMYSPFFFTAHGIAKLFSLQADGYTNIYVFALLFSCLFYLTLAYFVLRKLLLRWFSDTVTALTIICIGLGTNIFYYTTIEAPMSHAYNFSLFIFFIYFTISWYDKQRFSTTILLGLIGGLIVLIRPTNIIIWIFFLFLYISKPSDLLLRVQLLLKQYVKLLIIAACVVIVIFPQLLYWKIVTGSWIYYSYDNEGFFFNHPRILEGLFSYRKGWLLYTPVITFALIGIPFLWFKAKELFVPVLMFVIINIYIVFSWWTWWYGGGFSQRAMIDSYALLAFPLAAFISVVWKRSVSLKIISGVIITLLICHNLFQTSQYYYGAIHFDSMTKKAYWTSFLHIKPHGKYYDYLETPDYEKAMKGIEAVKPKNK
jgi:hypothetical protein